MQIHADPLLATSVSVSPHEPYLIQLAMFSWYPPFPLTTTIFPSLLLWNSPSFQKRDPMETSNYVFLKQRKGKHFQIYNNITQLEIFE